MASKNQSKYNKLQGKRVLIFGATSGIGYAVTEASIEHGAEVILSGSNQGRLDTTVRRLQKAYPEYKQPITSHVCDFIKIDKLIDALKSMFESITDKGSKPIHHIVFTAGDTMSFLTLDNVNADNVFDAAKVRLVGPLFIAKVAREYLSREIPREASITVTSGTNAAKPGPGWGVMAPWGAGILGLTRGLAVELAPHIRVNEVSPGAIQTELFDRFAAERPEALEGYRKSMLTEKIGQPDEIAEAYLYLMRDFNVTGQQLSSDGGRLLK